MTFCLAWRAHRDAHLVRRRIAQSDVAHQLGWLRTSGLLGKPHNVTLRPRVLAFAVLVQHADFRPACRPVPLPRYPLVPHPRVLQ